MSPSEADSAPWVPSALFHAPAPADETKGALDDLLTRMVQLGGSDLHLTVGQSPCPRINGALAPFTDWPALMPDDTEQMARGAVSEAQWKRFEVEHELDTAYSLPGVSRFRLNLYRQRGSVGAVFRAIPHRIPVLADLGLPPAVEKFAQLSKGLVLVTGPTGSGKTTTLASLLDVANRTRTEHIMTIEDPIEYLYSHQRCLVNQREVGSDTADFSAALRHALRQDPDIILVGELRDLETISVAITAAETGHLVLATLHTQSVAQTVDRLIDVFPPHQQSQIRVQLANCLQGVVSQTLAPTSDGYGRVAVCEVMVMTAAIRNLIRESKAHQIPMVLQSSAELGMISFDQHLAQRYAAGSVSGQTALALAHDPTEFQRMARF